MKKMSVLWCMLVTLLLTLLTARVTGAAALTCGTWNVVTGPSPGSQGNTLQGVAAVSASDIWAVGFYSNLGAPGQTLTEHWDGTSWSVVASPNPGGPNGNYLHGVAAVSASDIWAVGFYNPSSGPSQTLIEHWDGTSWSVVASPSPGSGEDFLQGVAAVSASNIWAVGIAGDVGGLEQALIEHWNGHKWSVAKNPNPGSAGNGLNGVTVVSASDIWAVGFYSNLGGLPQTLTEHWNGHKWSVVSSPNGGPNDNILNGVAAASASDIWAVGIFRNVGGIIQTLIEHWDGTSWSVVSSPNVVSNGDFLYGVAAVSASDIWAVGTYLTSSGSQTLIEQWDGTSWSVVASPSPGAGNSLNGVAQVPGSSNIWAVGSYGNGNIGQTLTEFYC